ncbi:hypothetical protein DRO55_06025 [Candidatus Bathyarchaeota archaeon]|nr:MAG: hypothetical protein DRO55_06025 [Candidatus Bathyarchaeota archaeon]
MSTQLSLLQLIWMAVQLIEWAFHEFLRLLQVTPEEIVAILIVPILIDMPRSIGKAIFLLLHGLYSRLTPRSEVDVKPMVSVIVPAHNEEEVIERTIKSLLKQDYPNREIIVVDDGSTDRTYEIASKFAERGLIKLVHRERASGKKARAVNYGFLYSKGDIIVTVDADTVLEPHTLSELVKPFSNPDVGAVSGNVRVMNRVNLLTRLQAYEYLMAMEMGRRFQAISGMLMIIPGALGAVRRRIAESLGLYDPDTMTEDFDITLKIHKTRMKVRFAPEAIGWTTVPESWCAWVKQRMRWTAGQLQTLIKHRNVFFRRYFKTIGLIATPDMLLMDIILLFVRATWLIALPLFYFRLIPQIFILTSLFYMLNELVIAAAAAVLSPRRRDLIYVPLVPIVVLFYRPLYGLVRMKAYMEALAGREFKW